MINSVRESCRPRNQGKYIEELETKWEIVPQFIQVEAHPYFTQTELRKTLDKYDIKLMSWYPLGHGDKSLINEPVFAELGKNERYYHRTDEQLIQFAGWKPDFEK